MTPDIPGIAGQPSHGESTPPTNVPRRRRTERIQPFNILIGIAILGALFINIWAFGGFNTNQQNGLLLQSKGVNYRLWGSMELLLNGKMRAIICLVFGAGMILFLEKSDRGNKISNSDLFIRRQMWLMAFGLINALIFLWPGDILFHLGIMGILLFPFIRLSGRALLAGAMVATLIFSAKTYWNYADDRNAYSKYLAVTNFEKEISRDSLLAAQKNADAKQVKKDSLSKQQQTDKSTWEGLLAGKKYDPKKKEEGFKEMRSASYSKTWNYLLPVTQAREAEWTYKTGVWDFGSMILLGMALMKSGFFSAGFSRLKYLWLILGGLTAGFLLGWLRLQYHQYELQDYTRYINRRWFPADLFFPFERTFLVLGYTSLVLFMVRSGLFRSVWKVFASVGKMPLTNYLVQSVICVLFFTGTGMGYFGRLSQFQLYLFVIEICIVQIVFSVLWMRYFYLGPAEWLLTCLMVGRWIPYKTRFPKQVQPSNVLLSCSLIL